MILLTTTLFVLALPQAPTHEYVLKPTWEHEKWVGALTHVCLIVSYVTRYQCTFAKADLPPVPKYGRADDGHLYPSRS